MTVTDDLSKCPKCGAIGPADEYHICGENLERLIQDLTNDRDGLQALVEQLQAELADWQKKYAESEEDVDVLCRKLAECKSQRDKLVGACVRFLAIREIKNALENMESE